MIVKVNEDRYVNLDQVKVFKIQYSDYEDGCVIDFDGNYFEIGADGYDCNEWWCGIIRKHFELALKEGKPYFDLYEMCLDKMNDKILNIYENENLIEEARVRKEAERLEDIRKKTTNPKGPAL